VLVTNPGGTGESRIYLGAQAVELGVSQGYNTRFYLGSGKVTFETTLGSAVTVTSADNWNVANVIKGVAPSPANMYLGATISLTFGEYGGTQTYDLRSASLSAVSISSNAANTFLVNSAVMAGVTSWNYGYSGESKLSVADASIDLGSAYLSNYKVVSTNTAGTTFTTTSSSTALQVQGGAGQDTLVLKNSSFTADQRNAIFATSSVETITDASGTYTKQAASFAFGIDDTETLFAFDDTPADHDHVPANAFRESTEHDHWYLYDSAVASVFSDYLL